MEDWGKLIGDVPSATAMVHVDTRILSRTYHHLAKNPLNLREAVNRVKAKASYLSLLTLE